MEAVYIAVIVVLLYKMIMLTHPVDVHNVVVTIGLQEIRDKWVGAKVPVAREYLTPESYSVPERLGTL